MNANPFKKIKRNEIYKGRVIDLCVDTVEYDNKEIKWEIIKSLNAVVVVPYLGNDKFVMVYQYRYTLGGYMWEFPAGRVEEGEDLIEGAQRELEEECQYRAGHMEICLNYFPSPGVFTERMTLLFASDLYKASNAQPDIDEIIHVKILSYNEIKEKIESGEIIDAKTILAFYHISLNKDKLIS